ncbi:acyclic terpene utilization AtuA family protein [Flavisphingomonas formosensis]|uniref:acyclic terpene utilization AtuA family protein n=1 Tax=Flavisphingomonas formosensis TaxID=861534 RepID=UPI0012FB4CFF|nr:acyclic terpene utilization AtuA family protein [Sphingomonas formosensis]
MKTVRIGGASSYYTDSTTSVPQLLKADPCPHYLMFDFMSEGTIGSMARSMASDPDGGYARDLMTIHIAGSLHDIVAKKVKLIANAGGMNPKGCAEAIEAMLKERGVALKVAYVDGDNLLAREAEVRKIAPTEMFSGEPFPEKVDSINVYLGAFPIAQALAEGADIVVTGRCADSALGLGPLIHEFGWKADEWDKLSAGTLVGHLLECGCQVTGGTFTDWEDVPGWEDVGFPIADVSADGSAVITKAEGTGGLVSVGTVAEQLLYEVSDPQAYIVADVVCDWSGVTLRQVGENRVSVSNARGYPATDTYKGVISYEAGWRGSYSQVIIGMDAVRKAQRQGEALVERGRRLLRGSNLGEFLRTDVDLVGAETAYGPHGRAADVREVFMRASVDHKEKAGVELYCREALASTSAMAVGSTATISVAITPLSKLFLFLMPKSAVEVSIVVAGKRMAAPQYGGQRFDPAALVRPAPPSGAETSDDMTEVPLIKLAWGRSGDKGNLFNVAAIARRPEYVPYIRASLDAQVVADRYAFLCDGVQPKVSTFEVPGFHAVNFVVHASMDGGILMSPRIDNAAKGMAQQLLETPIKVPAALVG